MEATATNLLSAFPDWMIRWPGGTLVPAPRFAAPPLKVYVKEKSVSCSSCGISLKRKEAKDIKTSSIFFALN